MTEPNRLEYATPSSRRRSLAWVVWLLAGLIPALLALLAWFLSRF